MVRFCSGDYKFLEREKFTMKQLLYIASLSICLLIGSAVQAENIKGTVTWNISGLQDNSGAKVIGLVLDYQYDSELETIPVNGYVVIIKGDTETFIPSLVHGTAMLFGEQGLLIYLNDLTLAYQIETDGTFSGFISLYDETGKLMGTGTLTLQQ